MLAIQRMAREAARPAAWAWRTVARTRPLISTGFGANVLRRYDMAHAPGFWADAFASRFAGGERQLPDAHLPLAPARRIQRDIGIARWRSPQSTPPEAWPQTDAQIEDADDPGAFSLLADAETFGWGTTGSPGVSPAVPPTIRPQSPIPAQPTASRTVERAPDLSVDAPRQAFIKPIPISGDTTVPAQAAASEHVEPAVQAPDALRSAEIVLPPHSMPEGMATEQASGEGQLLQRTEAPEPSASEPMPLRLAGTRPTALVKPQPDLLARMGVSAPPSVDPPSQAVESQPPALPLAPSILRRESDPQPSIIGSPEWNSLDTPKATLLATQNVNRMPSAPAGQAIRQPMPATDGGATVSAPVPQQDTSSIPPDNLAEPPETETAPHEPRIDSAAEPASLTESPQHSPSLALDLVRRYAPGSAVAEQPMTLMRIWDAPVGAAETATNSAAEHGSNMPSPIVPLLLQRVTAGIEGSGTPETRQASSIPLQRLSAAAPVGLLQRSGAPAAAQPAAVRSAIVAPPIREASRGDTRVASSVAQAQAIRRVSLQGNEQAPQVDWGAFPIARRAFEKPGFGSAHSFRSTEANIADGSPEETPPLISPTAARSFEAADEPLVADTAHVWGGSHSSPAGIGRIASMDDAPFGGMSDAPALSLAPTAVRTQAPPRTQEGAQVAWPASQRLDLVQPARSSANTHESPAETQRFTEVESTAQPTSGAAAAPPAQAKEPPIEELARKVYDHLRRRLLIEHERRGR